MVLCSLSELNETDKNRFRILVTDLDVNLNYVDASTGRTPLLLLCYSNQSADLLELITFLLRGDRVDINTEDRDGLNALLTVCFWYRGRHLLDIVQLMIRFNVELWMFAVLTGKAGIAYSHWLVMQMD